MQAEAVLSQSASAVGGLKISKEVSASQIQSYIEICGYGHRYRVGTPFLIFGSNQEELKRAQAEEREKRADAAERRMAALSGQAGGTTTSTSLPKGAVTADNIKCSCCESSLLGKVPFHRYNYKYCSTSCMHVHKEMLEDG